MMQFLAILKDSYYEAVDGFVIYVMLGLTGLLLLLMASLSFTPAPAEEVLPDLVKRFAVYVPERGHARPVAMGEGVTYSVSDTKKEGRNVTFRLTATSAGPAGGDAFRRTVAGWLKPAGEAQKFKVPHRQRGPREEQAAGLEVGLEFISDQRATQAEAAAVTDEQMAEFLADQFRIHAGMTGVVAKRASGPVEPTYSFEVTAPDATSARGWPQEIALFFGAWKFGRFPLGLAIHVVEDTIINGLGAGVALIIGVVITAFFIPNMLRKGALDLLIAKPIGRGQLLVYKYIGGLTFVFLLSVAAIGGTWVVIGLRSGHWAPQFLVVIPLLTFTFAILYAVSTLMAVLTRSAIAAILITLMFAFCLYLVGQFKSIADLKRNTGAPIMGETWPDWLYAFADSLNDYLPRYKDLDKLTSKVIDEGTLTPIEQRVKAGILEYPSWSGALGLSLAYIAGILALSVWRFKTRDS